MSAVTIGYEISSEEIIRVATEQREQEHQQASQQAITCGRFSCNPNTGTVIGPAEYMAERYASRMESINSGKDVVFNFGLAQHGNTVMAVLVSLQTDYAAWSGMKRFLK